MREHLYKGFYIHKDGMTEITLNGEKLKGWWVEGDLLTDYLTGQHFIHPHGDSVNESDKINEEGCLKFFAYEVLLETVREYIGLTDKNGKKIFEGHIVKARSSSCPYAVTYKDCAFEIKSNTGNQITATQEYIDWFEVEIIGDIYDTKEVL